MNDQKNEATPSDKSAVADADLDKVTGGGVLREVVRPPRPTSTSTQGGVVHEDTWNAQT